MKRQPTKPAPQPAPKSLKALLREYRKTYREHGKNLRKLEIASFSDVKEQLAANREAGASNNVAREAMIEAPVVSLDDIATKLRFYFKVSGGRFDSDGWEARIAKNILRDIEKPKGAGTLQELRKECVAVFGLLPWPTKSPIRNGSGFATFIRRAPTRYGWTGRSTGGSCRAQSRKTRSAQTGIFARRGREQDRRASRVGNGLRCCRRPAPDGR